MRFVLPLLNKKSYGYWLAFQTSVKIRTSKKITFFLLLSSFRFKDEQNENSHSLHHWDVLVHFFMVCRQCSLDGSSKVTFLTFVGLLLKKKITLLTPFLQLLAIFYRSINILATQLITVNKSFGRERCRVKWQRN